jgi:hypothetical protein
MKTAIEARQRVYGVSETEAPRQEAGSAVGRLWARGAVSQVQLDAAKSYRQIHALALRYEQPPHGLEVTGGGRPVDWDAEGFDQEAYTDRAISAIARYHGLRMALENIAAERVIYHTVIEDRDTPGWTLVKLREGLDLIARNAPLKA